MKTSSVSRATSASTSADSYARTNLATIASSERVPDCGGGPAASGGRRRKPARARLSALLTDSTVDAEHVGHLARVEAEDVAQDEDGELAGRQDLEGGHEGQRDGLGLLVAGLRAERHVDRPVEQGVGTRLEPHDLAEPGRLGRFDVRHVPLLGRSSAGRPARVEAPVGGDPVEPACAARRVPRTRRSPARRPAACPGGRPRRPAASRASGSSAPGAPAGAARSALGTRRRRRPAPRRRSARRHVHHLRRRIAVDTGPSRTGRPPSPSFPMSRCLHHRQPTWPGRRGTRR